MDERRDDVLNAGHRPVAAFTLEGRGHGPQENSFDNCSHALWERQLPPARHWECDELSCLDWPRHEEEHGEGTVGDVQQGVGEIRIA